MKRNPMTYARGECPLNETRDEAVSSIDWLDCTIHYHAGWFYVQRGEDVISYQPITKLMLKDGLSLGQIINEIQDVS